MKSFIIALLPGLEEETGEYFEKVLSVHCLEALELNASLRLLGTRNFGPAIRNSVPFVFPAKHLVDHADESAQSWDSSKLPRPPVTANRSRRRYPTAFAHAELH